MNKICSKCNMPFECESNENCWCFSIKLIKIEPGSKKLQDCMCEKCLVSLNTEQIKIDENDQTINST